jgi:hypothetical protein
MSNCFATAVVPAAAVSEIVAAPDATEAGRVQAGPSGVLVAMW